MLDQTELRVKKRHKFKIVKLLRLVLVGLLVILVLEFGWLAIANFPGKTVIADWGTIDKGCWVEALYLRDEMLITAPQDGFFHPKLPTGMKIPHGEVIGWMSDKKETIIPENLIELNTQLTMVQNEVRELKQDLERVNGELNEGKNNPSSKGFIKTPEELKLLGDEKNRIRSTIETLNSAITQIQQQMTELSATKLISARRSGFLSWEYDGYETELTPDNFQKLKEADFDRKYKLKSAGKRVKSDQIIGKITHPFRQMVVMLVDPKEVGKAKINDTWYVNAENSWKKISIVDIISLTKDKMIIGFKNQELEPFFLPERRRKIFVVYRRITGVRIPVQAIFKKDAKTVVRVVKGDDFEEKEIRVKISDGSKAIIEGIAFGTAIISR